MQAKTFLGVLRAVLFDLCAHRGPDWGPLALTPLCPLALIVLGSSG